MNISLHYVYVELCRRPRRHSGSLRSTRFFDAHACSLSDSVPGPHLLDDDDVYASACLSAAQYMPRPMDVLFLKHININANVMECHVTVSYIVPCGTSFGILLHMDFLQ